MTCHEASETEWSSVGRWTSPPSAGSFCCRFCLEECWEEEENGTVNVASKKSESFSNVERWKSWERSDNESDWIELSFNRIICVLDKSYGNGDDDKQEVHVINNEGESEETSVDGVDEWIEIWWFDG